MTAQNLGLLLDVKAGKCPSCASPNIQSISKCESCGTINKQCNTCGVKWQEFLEDEADP